MINALVDVVTVNPKYKRVLNAVIPSIASTANILKFCFKELIMFLCLIIRIGAIIKKTKNHLKKDNSKGVMSSLINLPITKLTDQNNTHRVIKK